MLTIRLLLAFALVCAAAAQVPSTEQALSFKRASNPRISPDGRFVAYDVRSTNWDDNAFDTQIWIAAPASGERYQLTSSNKSSSGARWSPDGKRLAFISDRNGKGQLYLISPTGGEALQLTNFDGGVNAAEWSPDGATIAFTSTGPEPEARKDRKKKYGEFEIVKNDYQMSHLWVVKAPSEFGEMPKPEQLTSGEKFTVGGFSWSPDSQRIAFAGARDPSPASGETTDIYLVRVVDKGVTKLVSTQGPDRNPVWSPDGKQIAFETAAGEEFFYLPQ